MSWTTERIELLKTLRAKGEGSSEIAFQLSLLPPYKAVTRNAVIGKAARLGLATSYRSGVGPYRKPRAKKNGSRRPLRSPVQFRKSKWATFAANLTAEPMPLSAENDIARVSFNDVKNHHCRWPVKDVHEAGLNTPMFCGADKVPGEPYCPGHCERAFNTPRLAKTNIPAPVSREKETA